MSTNTRQVYLPQQFPWRSTAVSMGRFLWHSVQMMPTMAAYLLYCLNDHVRRGRYQHVIHIPVSYENQGEHACHAA